AVKAAAAGWMLFFDDDIVPGSRLVRSYLQAIQDYPDAWGFGGPVHSRCEEGVPADVSLSGPDRLYLAWPEHDLGGEVRPYGANETPMGTNRVLSKRVFEAGERFRTEFAAAGLPASPEDDIGIGSRLIAAGRKIIYIPAAGVSHF